ncbi:MAG: GNAT family N-acetyltransferase [bacterium]
METLWSIRRYKKEDKEQCFELYKNVWGEQLAELSKRKWNWKFEDNPNNPEKDPFILVLEYKGKMVGLIAGLFTRVLIKGKIYHAPWLIDLMTHPKYRGRGYLLVKKAYEENPFTLNFSTELSYRIGSKMAGFDIHLFFNILMKRPLNLKNVIAKFIKNKLIIKLSTIPLNMLFELIFSPKKSPDITITQISSFDTRIDKFWMQMSKNFNAIVIRDKKYLNWRFVKCPDVKYTIFLAEKEDDIAGYIVLRVCQNTGYIVDFLAKKEGFESLIWQAIRYFRQQKTNSICCLEPKDTFYLKTFKKCGFFTRKGYPTYRFGSRSVLPDVPMEFLREPKNWFLTLGDSDIEMVM